MKPLILYLMIVYETMVFVRYLFNFTGEYKIIYDILLILQQSIESLIFFLICYFFTK